jgi:hypothetical protein
VQERHTWARNMVVGGSAKARMRPQVQVLKKGYKAKQNAANQEKSKARCVL